VDRKYAIKTHLYAMHISHPFAFSSTTLTISSAFSLINALAKGSVFISLSL